MKLDIKSLALVVIIAAVVGFFLFAPNGEGLKAAPSFTAQTIDGKALSTDDLKGKPYLAVFWATDCPTCIKEIPELVELQHKFKDQGFKVVAFALPHDEIDAIRAMREQKNMDYTIVFDQEGSISNAFGGIQVTPTNFLVSPNGKIVLHQLGMMDMGDVAQRISKMLKG